MVTSRPPRLRRSYLQRVLLPIFQVPLPRVSFFVYAFSSGFCLVAALYDWRLLGLPLLSIPTAPNYATFFQYHETTETQKCEKAPLTSFEARGEMEGTVWNGVPTDATRRLRSVRFGVQSVPCKTHSLCSCCLLIFKTRKGLTLSSDGERSSPVCRSRGTGTDGTTTPLAGLVRRVEVGGKNETAVVDFSVDVSATGSRFQDTPFISPDERTPEVVKRMMGLETPTLGRRSSIRRIFRRAGFVTFTKSANTEGVRPSRSFSSFSSEHLISENQYGRFWMSIVVSLHESAGLRRGRIDNRI